MNEERDIGGIGITVPDEALAVLGLVNSSFECPSRSGWIRELRDRFDMDAGAVTSSGQTNETGMSDVPATVKPEQISGFDRKPVTLRQRSISSRESVGGKIGFLRVP